MPVWSVPTLQRITATLIGYARCSTDKQGLTAQRRSLGDLGPHRYTDKRRAGANRARPGFEQAMVAVRKGGTLAAAEARPPGEAGSRCRHITDQL